MGRAEDPLVGKIEGKRFTGDQGRARTVTVRRRYNRRRSKENRRFTERGSGVGYGEAEERIRSGDGPEWTDINVEGRRR